MCARSCRDRFLFSLYWINQLSHFIPFFLSVLVSFFGTPPPTGFQFSFPPRSPVSSLHLSLYSFFFSLSPSLNREEASAEKEMRGSSVEEECNTAVVVEVVVVVVVVNHKARLAEIIINTWALLLLYWLVSRFRLNSSAHSFLPFFFPIMPTLSVLLASLRFNTTFLFLCIVLFYCKPCLSLLLLSSNSDICSSEGSWKAVTRFIGRHHWRRREREPVK